MATVNSKTKVCRICLKEERFKMSIFCEYATKANIQSRIQKYLKVNIQPTDIHPKYICYQCYSNLELIEKCVNNAKNSQKILNNNKCDSDDDFPFSEDESAEVEQSIKYAINVLKNHKSVCNGNKTLTDTTNKGKKEPNKLKAINIIPPIQTNSNDSNDTQTFIKDTLKSNQSFIKDTSNSNYSSLNNPISSYPKPIANNNFSILKNVKVNWNNVPNPCDDDQNKSIALPLINITGTANKENMPKIPSFRIESQSDDSQNQEIRDLSVRNERKRFLSDYYKSKYKSLKQVLKNV